MKKHVSQNAKLDSLAADLLRSTVLKDDEIDYIASRDGLFSSVRAKIIADNESRVERPGNITFIQRSAILTAAAAIIVVAVFGTMMLARRPNGRAVVLSTAIHGEQKPTGMTSSIEADIPPERIVSNPEIKQPVMRYVKAIEYRPVTIEKKAFIQPETGQEEQPPQFFALAGLRASEAAVDGSRIIRVELPRASLVSLGVNVPLDSDKQLIKTDLLVGPDGVPRAIRLVE
jgi:hypothetical protein